MIYIIKLVNLVKMKNSKINKLPLNIPIFLCGILIFITIAIIYKNSYKSTFKHRRSVPSIYYNGDIYSIYGSIGNPYTIYGPPQQPQIPYEMYNKSNDYPPPNASNFIYGPNASMLYNTM